MMKEDGNLTIVNNLPSFPSRVVLSWMIIYKINFYKVVSNHYNPEHTL